MNAAASLRLAAITVELGAWEYDIPALSASDWLEAFLGGWTAIVPGLLHPDDQVSIMRDFVRGEINSADIVTAAHAAAEAAGGRRWWTVERLVSTATDDELWPVLHGTLLLGGVDLDRLSLGGALNALYVAMVQNMKEDKRHQFDAQLDAPPPSAVAEEWDDAAAEDDFMAALGEQAKLHA